MLFVIKNLEKKKKRGARTCWVDGHSCKCGTSTQKQALRGRLKVKSGGLLLPNRAAAAELIAGFFKRLGLVDGKGRRKTLTDISN